MQKKLLISTMLIACFAFTVSAQYARRPLVEEFTNASCGPCAGQNPGFNAVLDATASKVTPIKFQTVWPGTDPMNAQNAAEVATRVTYYGVTGVPHGVLNGTNIANDCNAYDGAPACLTVAKVDAAYAETTPVNMNVSYVFSPAYDSLKIVVSVTSDVALSGALKLHVAIVEDAIFFSAAPGSNGEKEFFQVMRKMLPGAAGTTTGDFTSGETKEYTFNVKLPTYIYNKNQVGVTAWLQDDTNKQVHQSFRAAPASPQVNIPSAGTFVCTSGSSPIVTLNNTSDAALTSATIRYRIGTNAWEDYLWTGNVPAGGSTQITLPNTEITVAGISTLDVLVVASNNGAIQTNLNAGFGTITIKGLFAVGAPLPVGNTFQSAAFPPAGWDLTNVGANGWKLATNAGSGSTRSAKNNFFDYDAANTLLMTPKIDLSTMSGNTVLTFDHAYAFYNAGYQDSMRVEVTGDCGATWTTVFHDGYEGLATSPAVTTAFTPTAAQWASHSIDLSNFNGSADFFVRFVGESGYGNNLYLDNVNVSTATSVKTLELSTFTLSPNPTSDIAEVRFGLASAQEIQLMVYNALGSLVQTSDLGTLTSGQHSVSLDATRLNSGSYRVVLQSKEGIAQTQWIVLK